MRIENWATGANEATKTTGNDKRETILSAQNRNLNIAKFTQSYLIGIFLPLIFGRFKKKCYICSVEWCNHAPHKPMKHKP